MRIRDAFGIYNVLETQLKRTDRPLTCVDLFDHPDVKKFADSVNRVSDYLGHMYRRGLLSREPALKTLNSQAKWGYFWKNRSEVDAFKAAIVASKATPEPIASALELPAPLRKILSKPNIEITDNGGTVVIDLPELMITIRAKQ